MKKIVKFLKDNITSDEVTGFILIPFLIILCGLLFSAKVYNIPKVLPTELEAREEILAQFPDCENEIEEIVEVVTSSYPNAGSWSTLVSYLVCEFHQLKVEYFVPTR